MFTNLHNIPLPVQVWLAADEYNAHKEISKYLSATTILRPLKSVILGRRVDLSTVAKDVTDFIAVRRGTAIHDSIEKVWNDTELRANAMRKLGYPDKVIEMYKVKASMTSIPYIESITFTICISFSFCIVFSRLFCVIKPQ